VLSGLIQWLIERPRIEDDLRRTIRVGTPKELRDVGLDVSLSDARRLLARIDHLKEKLERRGWIGTIFKRTVEALTLFALGIIVFAWMDINVDHRLTKIAHWEAPAGGALMVFEWMTHLVRRLTLRTLESWYEEVEAYLRECDDEIRARWLNPRAPS
jgi:hypothetical protein